MNIWEIALGQLFALAAFFILPAFQYIWLKFVTQKEGQPALFYLPDMASVLLLETYLVRKYFQILNIRLTSGELSLHQLEQVWQHS